MANKKKKNKAKQAKQVARQEADATQRLPGAAQFYNKNFKLLLLIPLVLFILALGQVGFQIATTGDFVSKGISLKGGVTVVITASTDMSLQALEEQTVAQFPDLDVLVRELTQDGQRSAVVFSADVQDTAQRQLFVDHITTYFAGVTNDQISVEATGPSLGESFYVQALYALLAAFIFMAGMVYATFRKVVPSLLVILAALTNLVVTLAIFNMFGFKLSTAGLAAFLMLLGYSVDTDILLTSRVIRNHDGTVASRIFGAWKTGTMMSVTTFIAITVAFFFATSSVIHEIMTIILIGLVVDYINTWIQNAGLLRWSMQRGGSE